MKRSMASLVATSALCAFGVTGCAYESARTPPPYAGAPPPYVAQGTADFSVSLGNAQFAYSDGYYDNDRRWHDWRNDGERDWYRQNRAQTYYQMGRNEERDNNRRDWREGRRDDWRVSGGRGGGGETGFAVTLGDVVFAYSDGYYDNNRRWHKWRNTNERNWYSQNRGQTYFQMTRNRDRDENRRGWRDGRRDDWRVSSSGGGGETGFAVTLGDVVFAYSDGYYDNNRRWHKWRNTNERKWYSENRGQTYFQMTRNRDRDENRRGWRDGRRDDWRVSSSGGGRGDGVDFSISLGAVRYGYSDGYYDNDRKWHGWRNDGERDWYRRNHRASFYEMSHEDDRDHGRRQWRESSN